MKRPAQLLADYGMVLVLLLLCVYFSLVTLKKQKATGADGARALAAQIIADESGGGQVFVAAGTTPDDRPFAATLSDELKAAGFEVTTGQGSPGTVRKSLEALAASGTSLDLLACSPSTASWQVFDAFPDTPRLYPKERWWPDFLKRENLMNVANQIAVIAILAIGMTMVIITRGIDLSVGSLLALSAVATAYFIVKGGAEEASNTALFFASLGGIAICGAVGLFNGVLVTRFSLPPFIVTLGAMLIASGIAFDWSNNESIHQLPERFNWLGRAAITLPLVGLRLPVAVILMVVLYILAHLFMTRSVLGRYIYAIGGSPEAARLSGVPVNRVLVFAYTACGLLAGVGGVLMASQLESGSPTYGVTYELTVIAAVVVGGTSLMGGSGRIFGTFIGALIIAVIQNGMNLTGTEFGAQKYVLGTIILLAVLLDQVKRRWFEKLRGTS